MIYIINIYNIQIINNIEGLMSIGLNNTCIDNPAQSRIINLNIQSMSRILILNILIKKNKLMGCSASKKTPLINA